MKHTRDAFQIRLPIGAVALTGERPTMLDAALSDLWVPPGLAGPAASFVFEFSADGNGWHMRGHNSSSLWSTDDPLQLVDETLIRLNRLYLDNDPDNLHLHAGCVEFDERGILLVGPSGSGKTTLTTQLMAMGARYLTDEMIGLSTVNRTIRSYHKPLTLKDWAITRFVSSPQALVPRSAPSNKERRMAVAASMLGGLTDRTRPDIIVFPRYGELRETRIEPIDPERAIHLLVESCFDAKRYGPWMLDVLGAMIANASCWWLDYSDLTSGAELITRLPPRRSRLGWRARPDKSRGRELITESHRFTIDRTATTVRSIVYTEDSDESLSTKSQDEVFVPTLSEFTKLESAGLEPMVVGDLCIIAEAGWPLPSTRLDLGRPTLVVHRHHINAALSMVPSVQTLDTIMGGTDDEEMGFFASATWTRIRGQWLRIPCPEHRILIQSMGNLGETTTHHATERSTLVTAAQAKRTVTLADGLGIRGNLASMLQGFAAHGGEIAEPVRTALHRQTGSSPSGSHRTTARSRAERQQPDELDKRIQLRTHPAINAFRRSLVGLFGGAAQLGESMQRWIRDSEHHALAWRVSRGAGVQVELIWLKLAEGADAFPNRVTGLLRTAGASADATARADAVSITLDANDGGVTRIRMMYGNGPEMDNGGRWYQVERGITRLHEVIVQLDPTARTELLVEWIERSPVPRPGIQHHFEVMAQYATALQIGYRGTSNIVYAIGIPTTALSEFFGNLSWPLSEVSRVTEWTAELGIGELGLSLEMSVDEIGNATLTPGLIATERPTTAPEDGPTSA